MTNMYVGVYLVDKEALKKFWYLTCPCGVSVSYPANELPEVSTQHPCGKQDHWAVKYSGGAKSFSVGDKVICNDPWYSFGVGAHGVIVEALVNNMWMVQVEESQPDDPFCFRECDLEHAGE